MVIRLCIQNTGKTSNHQIGSTKNTANGMLNVPSIWNVAAFFDVHSSNLILPVKNHRVNRSVASRKQNIILRSHGHWPVDCLTICSGSAVANKDQ